MSFTATIQPTALDLDNTAPIVATAETETEIEQRLVEEFVRRLSAAADEMPVKRISRSSQLFFQNETSKRASQLCIPKESRQPPQTNRRNSFLGLDGKVQDDYIAKRASLNKHTEGQLGKEIPVLADLSQAASITEIDGNVLAQLFVSGYAKLGTKVNYLNKINVFPIADGDTGANMKVCLKLPSRNLVLDPSDSVLRVASNMAADVLLNGQGNSGTILSHFYVSLAEEIRDLEDPECHEALTINEFSSCLVKVGGKMADSVPNPVEGTLLSVARDSCEGLAGREYSNLKELLDVWKELAEAELKATPDKLIVDGVKVLEKAGVVDSGAQGFFYVVEGMWLASKGELPEASDPQLFQTAVKPEEGLENLSDTVDDHFACDSKYRYCTEAVILLKDGVAKDEVMNTIDLQCHEIIETDQDTSSSSSSGSCACQKRGPLGDSVASVSAPAKEGGNMLKLHIHTNEPQRFFDTLKPYSRDVIFKKEKVEDMKIMRDVEHGSNNTAADAPDTYDSVDNAKFTMIGLSSMCLPPTVLKENEKILQDFPLFIVPSDTNEPIDIRYATDTETLLALNKQRNPKTAVRMTTASSTPMQMKIELLAAIAKGKPVLVMIFSATKKVSAFGRNVLQAIDMLDPDQKDKVKVFVHGWAHDGVFMLEAIKCARRGQTIDEAIAVCEDIGHRTYGKVGFMNTAMFRSMKAWRPHLFPDGFDIPEGYQSLSGPPAGIRPDGVAVEKRIQLALAPIEMGTSTKDAYEKAAKHIKSGLLPGQKIGNVLLPCVGRPDLGNLLIEKIEEEGIEIVGTPYVYNEGMIGTVMGSWGSISLTYQIIEE